MIDGVKNRYGLGEFKMNIKKTVMLCVVALAISASAIDYVEVIDVSARQRYPWNGLVDLDFALDSKTTEPYRMCVYAYDNDGKTNLPVKTVCTEGISFKENPCMVARETRRIVWDAGADLTDGFKCTNVLVTCRDERMEPDYKRYMIIDLSEGSSATRYPIAYTNCPPVGGWTDEHKRTKIVLRKVDAGSYLMGSNDAEPGRGDDEIQHMVTITKPYYLSIFPITENQYYQVLGSGTRTMFPKRMNWGAVRGWDISASSSGALKLVKDSDGGGGYYHVDFTVTQEATAGSYCWPDKSAVDAASFMGKIRDRTELLVDLPTEAQWEMACRAGSLTPLNVGVVDSPENRMHVVSKSGVVGLSMPNALGIYDMASTNGEWCLDIYAADLGTSAVLNPQGPKLSGNAIRTTLASGMEVYSVDFYTYSLVCTYNGKTYTSDSFYTWNDSSVYMYCYAYGCRRVVRGLSCRSARRSYAYSINPNFAIFTSGVNFKKRGSSGSYYESTTKKLSRSNPSHCVRVCIPAED